MSKKIPLGISNFKEIIEENYYYIDKTKFIDDLIQDGSKVKLFTRPRRFGKTLNMSTLRYFFDIVNAEENRKLFKNLYIEKSETFKYQGQYPVIFISLKELKSQTYDELLDSIRTLISEIFYTFEFLIDKLDEFTSPLFKSYILKTSKVNELNNSLKFLSKIIYRYMGKRVIIIIDEYDTPVVSAYEHGYYNEAISFFKTFFGVALKDNEYLQMGIMTGILRVAKEGIFSGLNNLITYSILDENYSSYFGLTEKEVKKALFDFEIEDKVNEVKDWYDGYLFGNTELYNPWSIINYLSKKKLEPYWVNTSNNFLVYDLLNKAKIDVFNDLQTVFQGKPIYKTLDNSFSFQDMNNPQEVWQLLLYSGYLKISEILPESKYALKIPNKEINSFFEKSFLNRFLGGIDLFQEMIEALENQKINLFEKKLQEIMLVSVSYNDLGKEEKYYHNLILGMILSMSKNYEIHSNSESGYGRYDISLEPNDKTKAGIILEIKVAKFKDELDKKLEEALKQIEKRGYDTVMRQRGIKKILKIGLAFYGKEIKIKYSE
ncbi:AAA family ATPase [Fusobacterium gastrosuis]|uniref:AAA family ATPase n=1 Tax=Fusobacterium gastrosuis TaxID=1755100 RepID=UPI00297A25BE|nr:AAA family ATPase [Fusobacteriaceae bacterium]MDY5305364.1 AAA family ATPase [Fusobacterium gastrosuis]MDY5712828.1 AAA family ATPase [Fusobacterium gastrosuis]